MARVYDAIEKDVRYTNKAILDSANGEHCQVNSYCCNHNPKTVVWAHSNYPEHGKAASVKAHDIFGCYACSMCHRWLDGGALHAHTHNADIYEAFIRSMCRSWLILVRKGVLK